MVSAHSKKMREAIVSAIRSNNEVYVSGVPANVVSQWLHRVGSILDLNFYRRSVGSMLAIGVVKKMHKNSEAPHSVAALLEVVESIEGKGEIPMPPILRPCGAPYSKATVYSAATKIRAMGEYQIVIKSLPNKPSITVTKI